MSETLRDWLNESPENARLYAQEDLLLSASEAIWEAMGARGLTKADIARMTGQSKAHITQLLNGGRNMTLRTLADIAHTMGLKVSIQLVAISKPSDSTSNEG